MMLKALREAWRNYWQRISLLVAGTLLLANAIVVWNFTADDAFAMFRYAENVANGYGPVFNPGGPPTEGFTSPLWLAILSLASVVGLDLLFFSKVAGLALILGSIYVIQRMYVESRGGLLAIIAALPVVAIHAVSGMDTALTTFTLALFITSCEERETWEWRPWVYGLLLSLSRPEFAIVALVGLGVTYGWTARPTFMFVFYGWLYFVVRAVVFETLPLPLYVKGFESGFIPTASALLMWAGLLGVLVLVGWVEISRRLQRLIMVAFLVVPVYMLTSPVMNYSWRYLFPLFPWVFYVGMLGVREMARERKILALGGAILVASLFVTQLRDVWAAQAYSQRLEGAHVRLGKFLSKIWSPDRPLVLAVSDAGALPYYSGWKTIDLMGLHNGTIARGGVDTTAIDVAVLLSRKQDVFEPIVECDGAAYEREKGRKEVAIKVKFDDEYFLWVFVPNGSAKYFANVREGI